MIRSSAFDIERRRANRPRPKYPDDLPVVAHREEIARAIESHPVVIVCGETGSGKTTQLPKICLELGRGVAGMIGHTQPRRIAARSVAARIASELASPLGHAVGYKVRFADRVSADTYIKVMTDGILLAETQGDRLLRAYDTLIIDEAHERSLNIDFLLGYLKELLQGSAGRRPDLKLIVTSATIDAERFSRHFSGAPVIEVSGRLYPVEVRYRPLGGALARSEGESGTEDEEQMVDGIVNAVGDLVRQPGGGDILVFLPGEREIREAAEALRGHSFKGAEILPLYGRLSLADQERVFHPGGARRIVLATNVAETSLTVPGIRYVVDTGFARVNRYSYRNKVEQLLTEPVSQASADQRAGRCGRVAAGVCVRLYAEEEYRSRPRFTDPEILRSSLAGVILRMKALGLPDVERFPFLDPPAPRMIADGYQLLGELGALNGANELTAVGRRLARFPIDPRVARMILAAEHENCLAEMLVIAAVLEVDDPRERPFERAEAADRAHARFHDERSDFMSLLKVWEHFEDEDGKSRRKQERELRDQFISPRRLREWRDVHRQLKALAAELSMSVNGKPASYEQVHRALIAGLLGNVGTKGEEAGEYLGARGIRFWIFPGSGLRKKPPRWALAAELVETTRLYARCVARIEPEWVEAAAGDLVQRHYFDPHWEKERAMVAAYERVTLYGLTLVSRRRVNYGPINPREAREVLIRGALVAGEFDTRAPFLAHNRQLVKEVEALEHKARRRDVLVDDEVIYAFYDGVVPPDIVNGAGFERWRTEAERAHPRLLYLTRDYLMRHAAAEITEALYPERIRVEGADLKLAYRFDPGHPLDGVTASVPLPLLNRFEPAAFEWLVPGLIREKVGHLLKSLPKRLRRHLLPPAQHVTAFLTETEERETRNQQRETLPKALARYVQRVAGEPVTPNVWDDADTPAHLAMNFRVVDESGRELAAGRDLVALQKQLGQAARITFAAAQPGIEKKGIRAWDFGELPAEISFTRDGRRLTGFPALADEQESVAIRLFDTRGAADAEMRGGVRRLMRLALNEQMKQLEKRLPGLSQAALALRSVADADALKEDLLTAVADRAFIGEDELPRSEREFDALKQRARARLPAVAEAACRLLAASAGDWQRVRERLEASARAAPQPVADLRAQLARLVYKGFISATPWERLHDLPRYLKAMERRLERCREDADRDAKHAASVQELWKRYEERAVKLRKAGEADPRLEDFRWRLEELRVSLYAQELKTPYPVSFKRLDRLWHEIVRTR